MAGGYLSPRRFAAHPRDHTAAFAAYEARLRPFVAERQRRARTRARGLVPATRTGQSVQRMVTRFVLRDTCAPLLRFGFGFGFGFGDTSSILPTPPNNTKETAQ
ncbi:hypothetical protein ACIBI3_43885 [Actinomadura luteofluorescens]|uniref:hypothetical protein n=1 Tax=Actinomadura luteofluorescens TaxID=46163 RepID=UPI0034713F1D